MPSNLKITFGIAVALAASACSTKPRQFSATVRPSAESTVALQGEEDIYATCNDLVRKGHKGNFAAAAGSTGAGLAAAAATTGTVVLNGAVAPSFMAVSSVAVAAVPVIGVFASIGTSRLIRGGREKSYRKHMSACFAENGYEVVDWERMKKKQVATAHLLPSESGSATLAEAATTATEPPAPQPALALGDAS